MSVLADMLVIYAYFIGIGFLVAMTAVLVMTTVDWLRDRRCARYATSETRLIDELEQLWRLTP